MSRPRLFLLVLCVYLVGLGAGVYLHWHALLYEGAFKEDSVQAPHWAAYHTTSFRPDDLLLRYASFNESPLQNAIYWTGTWFVDSIRLGKLLAVASYGLLSAVFFFVGRAMCGVRFGLLLALFITFFPGQWEFSPGFFSKFWMVPLLLLCVYALETDRVKWLVWLLPVAALAYPTSAFLIGLTGSVFWIQECWTRRDRARALFRQLAIGSALAVAVLLVKYVSPPDFIGPMRPGAELREMPELRSGGFPSNYIPIPSLESELLEHLEHPFVLLGAVLFFVVLGRGVAWRRSWTALLFASAIGYLLADLFFMHLYIPNRYTRYSMGVLLALWNAGNWDLVLGRLNTRVARVGALVGLLVVGGFLYRDTFEPWQGSTDNRDLVPVCRHIREELPDGVLIAGSPRALDVVMVLGRRSVLCPYKLAHPWFVNYYAEIEERTRATLAAHFAVGPEPLNELSRRWGATHFLVDKTLFDRLFREQRVYANPYNAEVYEMVAENRSRRYLWPPPPGLYVWEDRRYGLIELPIPLAGAGSGADLGR